MRATFCLSNLLRCFLVGFNVLDLGCAGFFMLTFLA
jgi:hypothetical protein